MKKKKKKKKKRREERFKGEKMQRDRDEIEYRSVDIVAGNMRSFLGEKDRRSTSHSARRARHNRNLSICDEYNMLKINFKLI